VNADNNHTIGKNLILTAVAEIVFCMFGEKAQKELQQLHHQMIQLQGELVIWRMTQKNNLSQQLEVVLALVSTR